MPGLRASRSLLIVASMLLLCGCGHTQRVGSNRTLRIEETEYRLIPQDVTVSAGNLIILVHNHGRLTHNLIVFRNGHQEAATKPIPPGHNDQLTVLLRPGNYLMASTILSDQSLGQYGTLTVTP